MGPDDKRPATVRDEDVAGALNDTTGNASTEGETGSTEGKDAFGRRRTIEVRGDITFKAIYLDNKTAQLEALNYLFEFAEKREKEKRENEAHKPQEGEGE